MSMRALIVDDEADARENLRIMLEDNCPEVEVVGQASSAQEARELIGTLRPTALFLDIKMPGEDGFSLLHSIADKEIRHGVHHRIRRVRIACLQGECTGLSGETHRPG